MENQQNDRCRNCGYPLRPEDRYCPQCSQKNTDGRFSFGELMEQFFESLLNIEGRIFQTLGALVIPGKLSRDFFQGKHVRYYHPIRLFVLSGALLIAMVSFLISKKDISQVDDSWQRKERIYQQKRLYNDLDTLSRELEDQYNDPVLNLAFDTLRHRLTVSHQLEEADSIEIPVALEFSDQTKKDRIVKVALEDVLNMNEPDLAEKYGVTDFWKKQIFWQYIRINQSARNFLFFAFGNILWMMLIMMPMLALVLKLLYVRRGFLYIEHLVFSFHTHTFVFLFFTLLFFIGQWTGYHIALWGLFPVVIYLVLALKRFYGQGWIKTISKFILANLFYLAIFSGSLFIVMLASMLLF